MSSQESKITTDHNQIKKWVEERGGSPATVKGTEHKGDEVGLLRIDFPGYSGEGKLEKITWDEFFEKFEESQLAFLYQEETKDHKESRFFKFVSREQGSEGEQGGRSRRAQERIEGMSLFDIIKSDHANVKRTLQRLVESSKRAKKTREDQLEVLKDELLPHMHAEESLFYPFLQDESDEPELALVALEEHQVARNVLADVESTSVDDDRWSAKVEVLQEFLRHHMQEEESTIFDKAMELIDEDQADRMGQQFQALKKEAMAGSR